MLNLSPLQKFIMQRSIADGSMGAAGQKAIPVAPGMADPYNQGAEAPPLLNPEDGQNEFDPKRRPPRPYIDPNKMGGMF